MEPLLSVADLVELGKLISAARHAEDEMRALLDRYDAGSVSLEELKAALSALTLRRQRIRMLCQRRLKIAQSWRLKIAHLRLSGRPALGSSGGSLLGGGRGEALP